MMKLLTILGGIGSLAAAAPHMVQDNEPTRTQSLDKRATTVCGQWDSVQTGGYTVYNNLWGKDSGTGSQCLTVDGISSGLLRWSTTWSWSGGPYNVKSYPNAVLQAPAARVSTISSIPSRWQWSYSGSNLVANVAYDLFSNGDCGSTPQYEIMIWLGALGGAGPISSSGSPIATPSIGGTSWKLYKGPNGQMTVFSFVASSQQQNFSGDLNNFVKYLVSSQGYPSSQCIYSVGAGTEPFTGSNAKFTTTGYSASLSASSGGGGGGGGGNCAAKWAQCGGQGWTGLVSGDGGPKFLPVPPDALGQEIDPSKGYRVEAFGDGVYMLTESQYQVMFLVSNNGVIVVDAPPTIGKMILYGIGNTTDIPVTHLVYSHSHADHIGAAYLFDLDIKIRLTPDVTFDDDYTVKVGNQTLQLAYKGLAHEPGNIFIYAPRQKVLMVVDIVYPGWTPFADLGQAMFVPGYIKAYDQVLEYDFKHFVGGHLGRSGTRRDVIIGREYVQDLKENYSPRSRQISQYYQPLGVVQGLPRYLTDYCYNKTLNKWGTTLAAADVFGYSNAEVMVESLRIDFGILGPFAVAVDHFNAINDKLPHQLRNVVKSADADDKVHCIIFKDNGPGHCGYDLHRSARHAVRGEKVDNRLVRQGYDSLVDYQL
ncbi:endoglucanase [Paramyrothecium foliicola]|nr:endoglucanase [Paramyrothecium foliicola]